MKQLGLIVVFILPLCISAKVVLLRRILVEQDAVYNRDLESTTDGNSRRWLNDLESHNDEETYTKQHGGDLYSIAGEAGDIISNILHKRMESDGEETKTPKSTLSPHAPEFVPQSPQAYSPQQSQVESTRSPQGASQHAVPAVRASTSTLTPDQKALLDHVKAVSESRSPTLRLPQQSPSDRTQQSPPSHPPVITPSEVSESIENLKLNSPRLSLVGGPEQVPLQSLSSHLGTRKESRFFPGGRQVWQNPDKESTQTRTSSPPRDVSPPRSPIDQQVYGSKRPLTIKVPRPQFQPDSSPPSHPPVQPISFPQPPPFIIPGQASQYFTPPSYLVPPPQPHWDLSQPPPWHHEAMLPPPVPPFQSASYGHMYPPMSPPGSPHRSIPPPRPPPLNPPPGFRPAMLPPPSQPRPIPQMRPIPPGRYPPFYPETHSLSRPPPLGVSGNSPQGPLFIVGHGSPQPLRSPSYPLRSPGSSPPGRPSSAGTSRPQTVVVTPHKNLQNNKNGRSG